MHIVINIILLIIGFALLVKGADCFVDGSSSIAKLLRVPSVIIGLTIVSMGTSLPELAVSVSAAIKGENAIAISNVVGSNVFNLLVVLGVCAVIKPLPVTSSILKREYPLCIIATAIFGIFSADLIMSGHIGNINLFSKGQGNTFVGTMDRIDGIVFLGIFVVFIVMSVVQAMNSRKYGNEDINDETQNEPMKPIWSVVYIIGGIAAISIGGQIVVDSAKNIASACGMSDTLVGLTIVALGTSLPELVTSVVASGKGENDLAIGNVVGSNLFNILFILGASATIKPVPVMFNSVLDIVILLFFTIICYIFAFGKKTVSRYEGFTMLGFYIIYMVYVIIR